MGRYMCEHLMDAGYSATVYNRTRAKCAPLEEKGAVVVDTPEAVAAASGKSAFLSRSRSLLLQEILLFNLAVETVPFSTTVSCAAVY